MNTPSRRHRCSKRRPAVGALVLAALLQACTPTPTEQHADVIVVGAGIAGLSAALEAAAGGARVLVVEANSVGGGHAVKAGGFALVDTELQRSKGIADTPQLAFDDWRKRGVDPDAYWTDRYARESAAEVYDWLTARGVEFKMILPTREDSVPRFHFTRGTAVNAVVPLLTAALNNPAISFAWNTRVTGLARTRGRISGVAGARQRDGAKMIYRANAVILSTGGFESNLELVRANWPADAVLPPRLLAGAGQFATGDGIAMARWAGARFNQLDRHVIFDNGLPNPRDPTGQSGLNARNPAAIWVNATGRRFINEAAPETEVTRLLESQPQRGYWLLFDATGARRMNVRDAPWLTADRVQSEILDNPALTVKADSIAELAAAAGLPEHGVRTTLETWNRMVDAGEDFQFGRFTRDQPARDARALRTPPYYAVRVYPMTRKSMGGPAINLRAEVLDAAGTPIPGLYAAGELTGVAGINGRYGGAGTFLGPAVLTGRIAGQAAAANAGSAESYAPVPAPGPLRGNLQADASSPGYWHYAVAHALVAERRYACGSCHMSPESMRPAATPELMLERLATCTTCH
ncbi:MAG: FAD-dependent oxidoreductase [Gammaproteobacteria bacterium]|jgi:flavocytochrome c|nr:FAD-dependent oxidoreductase [Gammaproteobacteria bacterium]